MLWYSEGTLVMSKHCNGFRKFFEELTRLESFRWQTLAKSDDNGPKLMCWTNMECYAFSLVVLECNVFTLKGFLDLITP